MTDPVWVKSERQRERERIRRSQGLRGASVAATSAILFVVLVAVVVLNAPGWPRVQDAFFDPELFALSLPAVAEGFLINVKIFLIAEPIILVVGVIVAVVRSTTNPALFPFRALATFYVDLFRGIPTLLVIYIVGFGLPGLKLQGIPNDLVTLGVIALTLTYGAYVAEVIKSGIESIHPSQVASARSLGLNRGQTLRFVVLPQAARRVVVPLLNDFVALQKETSLVSTLGLLEAVRQAQIISSKHFDYTSYLVASMLFVLITIPLARYTDYLAAKARRRQGSS